MSDAASFPDVAPRFLARPALSTTSTHYPLALLKPVIVTCPRLSRMAIRYRVRFSSSSSYWESPFRWRACPKLVA